MMTSGTQKLVTIDPMQVMRVDPVRESIVLRAGQVELRLPHPVAMSQRDWEDLDSWIRITIDRLKSIGQELSS